MRTLQIQHDTTNLLGSFQEPLAAAGEIEIWRTWLDRPPADLSAYDAVVLMGGVAMPDQDDIHPWIPAELQLLREGLERELPMLGVCFGGQVLARAAGAAVGPARASEIGWCDIGLLSAGEEDPLIGPLGVGYRAFQWHHYGFEIPPTAVPLAFNQESDQAYRVGRAAWGLQFHIEADRSTVDWWIEAGRNDLDAHGVDVPALRRETYERIEANAAAAAALAERFVEIVHEHDHS